MVQDPMLRAGFSLGLGSIWTEKRPRKCASSPKEMNSIRRTPFLAGLAVSLVLGCAGAQSSATSAKGLHFDHLAVEVSKLDRSAEFYATVLQLEETFDATDKAHIRWFSLGEDRQLHIIASETFAGALGKGVHLALTTNDFDAFVQHVDALQVPYESWPGDKSKSNVRPDGVRQIYLQDPDGYWIEINDASTRWPTPKVP